jgi:cell division protein ZapA (FtsZ GTPase activity inhibitor)
MPNTEAVRVTIFNQNYSLVASEEPGRIEQLAQKVDDLMSDISARSGHIDAMRAAVLACLHLADQLDGVENKFSALKNRVDDQAQRFTELLDEAIGDRKLAAAPAGRDS